MEGVSVSSVFWYAPFDNAGEMAVAEALARSPYVDLTVQSISERFGQRGRSAQCLGSASRFT